MKTKTKKKRKEQEESEQVMKISEEILKKEWNTEKDEKWDDL